jgi:hypothetical protein
VVLSASAGGVSVRGGVGGVRGVGGVCYCSTGWAPPAVVPGRPTKKQKPSKKWTDPEWVNVLASTNAGPAHVTK